MGPYVIRSGEEDHVEIILNVHVICQLSMESVRWFHTWAPSIELIRT